MLPPMQNGNGMPEQLIKKLEGLVATGTQLAPLGGFDFSGYNARLQNKYLDWRKACLETMEQVGPIGFPYKNRILADQNGGYFFQSSALLILGATRELFEKLKASPELGAATEPAPVVSSQQPTASDTGGGRVLKPPPKSAATAKPTPEPAAAAPTACADCVYVIGEKSDPLRLQLADFLGELGIREVPIDRQRGQMLALDGLSTESNARYAFFVINSDDLAYAMFEIGHFMGKLGSGRVCVLHMTDVNFPKNVPGVTVKPIVVKLEEASLSLIKELKMVGYKINL